MKSKYIVISITLICIISLTGLSLGIYSVAANDYKNFDQILDKRILYFEETVIEVNYPTPKTVTITDKDDVQYILDTLQLAGYKPKKYEIYYNVASFKIIQGGNTYAFTPNGNTIKHNGKEYKTNYNFYELIFRIADKYE